MTDEDIADTAVFAEAFHVAFDGEAFGFKLGFPGVGVFAGHVVAGVVSGYDHKWRQMDFFGLIGVYLAEQNRPMWIRHVLVPGINSDEASLRATAAFIDSLGGAVQRVDVLPYHTLGVFKWKALGIPYELENVPTPDKQMLALARDILRAGDR